MFRSYSMELAGRTLTAEIGRVAGKRRMPDALRRYNRSGNGNCIR